MSKISLKKGESIDDALRRFKKKVSKAGVLKEVKNRRFYQSKSVKRKKAVSEVKRKLSN